MNPGEPVQTGDRGRLERVRDYGTRTPTSSARYSIALFQREVEPLHTPAYDLSSFLSKNPSWLVHSFTGNTIDALLAPRDFDCIILGVDALYREEAVLKRLSARLPPTGLLILHQLQRDALSFFKDGLTLTQSELASETAEAYVPAAIGDQRDEPLLNWPKHLRLDSSSRGSRFSVCGRSTWYLEVPEWGAWRTVLEVEARRKRAPVVIRTEVSHTPRIVVCYLFLEPREPVGAQLLENMIAFCSEGVPEVAILTPDAPASSATSHKLRLLGTGVAERQVGLDEGDVFEDWPVRLAGTTILEGAWASAPPSPAMNRWLARGGTVARSREGAGLTFQYGSTDEHWLARQWMIWFRSIDPVSWQGGTDEVGQVQRGSLFKTRAILRVLDRLHTDRNVNAKRLGLGSPTDFRSIAAALIARRMCTEGDFDCTISTTAAACDIDALVGGTATKMGGTREWLRKRFPTATAEDRFDIARCLHRQDLFNDAYSRLKAEAADAAEMRPLLLARIRAAALACHVEPSTIASCTVAAKEVADLDLSLPLAAEYLDALIHLHAHQEVAWLEGEDAQRALRTLRRLGRLPRLNDALTDGNASVAEPEVLCAETLALHSLFALNPTTTRLLHESIRNYPPNVVEPILEQNRHMLRLLTERQHDLLVLHRVRHVFGGLATLVAIAPLAVLLATLHFSAENAAFGVILSAASYAALMFGLDRLGLRPRWTDSFLAALGDGLPGVPRWIGGRIRGHDSAAAPEKH